MFISCTIDSFREAPSAMEAQNSAASDGAVSVASPDAAQLEESAVASEAETVVSPPSGPSPLASTQDPSDEVQVEQTTGATADRIQAQAPTASEAEAATSPAHPQSTQTAAITGSVDTPPAPPAASAHATNTQNPPVEPGSDVPDTPPTATSPPESTPFGRWRPGYLRKSALFAFCCIFLALLAAVEAIYLASESRDGLAESNESLSWLWTFSPTVGTSSIRVPTSFGMKYSVAKKIRHLALTILASLWFRVAYQAMRYTPWIRLARWEAESPGAPENKAPRSASRTLLVDYPNMSPPKALWKAVTGRDHLVTAALVVSFVIYIMITISTGLINSEPRQFSEAISVLVEDRLTATGRDDGRSSVPMVAINGMVALNMTVPRGHTRRHAFQWFVPNQDAANKPFSAVEATVGAASVDVQCEVASLDNPKEPSVPDTLFLRFNSSYCGSRRYIVENQAQNSEPVPQGTSYFWVYDDRAACQNNRKGIFLAAVVAVDRKGDNLTYTSSSRVMCSVGIALGNATVRISDDGQPSIVSFSMGPREADTDVLSEIQTHRLDNIRYGSDLQAHTGPDYMRELELSPFRVGASLRSGGPPAVTALLEHSTLEEVVAAWTQHFGALLLHYNHRSPQQQMVAGEAFVNRNRLVVNKNIAHGMAGGFALMAVMAAWMVFQAPPSKGFLPRDPDTVSGCAVLLSRSSNVLDILHGTGHKPLKDITKQISGTYRTVIRPSPDNRLSPWFFLRKDGPEPSGIPETGGGQGAQASGFRPWSPLGLRRPVRCVGLVAMFAIGATALGLLYRSNRDRGFFNTGDDSNIQYLWTVLPTLVMEALTVYVKSSDFSIRALAPFTALQSRGDTFERALAVSYTNELGPATIYKAARQGNWTVVLSKIMAILCTLLPIVSNALFSVENLEVEVGVQIQQQTWFGSGDYETVSWEAPAFVADMLLRPDVNSTFPPWSYEDWAFHAHQPVGDDVRSAEGMNTSVRARLAAVTVDLTCELSVTPGPIEATNGIQLEVGGRNMSCFDGFSCRKHRYFGGSIGGSDQFPVCATTTGLISGLPPTNYVWGRCAGDAVDFIARLVCNETAVEQDFDATLSGTDLGLDTTLQPPIPLANTTRPYSFRGTINDLYTGLFPGDFNVVESPAGAYLDRFFRSLVTRRSAMPLSHLGSPSNSEAVLAAIKKQHGIIRAQTLNYDGRSKMAVTRALRLAFANDTGAGSNHTRAQYPPFTASQPAPQAATLRYSPNRLMQSATATYVILAVLALVIVLDAASIVTTKEVRMPKSPGGIAAIASLLADSTIFKHLPPEGVEWMGDGELAGHFRGRGVTFKMDWFGGRNGRRYYTIGVVEDEQLALGDVEIRDGRGDGDRDDGRGDGHPLISGAAPIGRLPVTPSMALPPR